MRAFSICFAERRHLFALVAAVCGYVACAVVVFLPGVSSLMATEVRADPATAGSVGAARRSGGAKEGRVTDPLKIFEMLRAERRITSGRDFFKDAKFVGSEACKGCHAEQHAEWATTWHAKMEQWPTAETVLGDFNDRTITYRGIKVKDRAGAESTVTFDVKTHKDKDGFYFTVLDRDNAANDQTFKIAKTLGGKWDQGYEIRIGVNYYPAILRYSVKQEAWLVQAFFPQLWVEPDGTADGRPRRVDELPMIRTAEAKCAGCHTSGFTFEKDKASGIWKAHGEGELGVGCEKCHGPGSAHVKAAEEAKATGRKLADAELRIVHGLKDLDHNQQTQLCAQCHGRSTNRKQTDLTFPQGFLPGDTDIMEHLVFWTYQGNGNPDQSRYFYRNDWAKRNRQQWQDFSKSTHFNKAGMSCLNCHTFHGKWKDMQLRQTPTEQCSGCHSAEGRAMRPQVELYQNSKMDQAGVRCIDCHMARIGFRSHLVEGTHKQKHYPMDGSSHIFQVATPQLKMQFGLRTACEVCHTKDRPLPPHVYEWSMQRPMTDAELHAKLTGIQSTVRGLLGDVMAGIGSLRGKPSVRHQARIEKARANADLVKLDGSMGFHNPAKAKELLVEALRLLKGAGSPGAAASLAALQRGASAGTSTAAHADGAQPQPTQSPSDQGGRAMVAVASFAAVSIDVAAKPAPGKGAAKPEPGASASALDGTANGALSSAVRSVNAAAVAGAGPERGAWYVSREGDNLWKLAVTLYGAGVKYPRIYKANSQRMTSPDYLPPGTRLWLPD